MNINIEESIKYLKDFSGYYQKENNKEVVFCPTYTSLAGSVNKRLDLVKYGAQNVNSHKSGAHTGEISISMLKELFCEYCIVGHSERRSLYSDNNYDINLKLKLLLENSIIPILCVGETEKERQSGNSCNIVTEQLSACLEGMTLSDENKILIAYEPVWAIGSGNNATISDVSSMNETIVNHMNTLGYKTDQFYILYGGSVNINNILDLKSAKYLNGFLIGGASLNPLDFWNIINK